MGKAGRWLRSFLAGKKDGGRRGKQGQCDATPLAVMPAAASPREKKRWSFRRPASPGKVAAPAPSTPEPIVPGTAGGLSVSERELEQSKHAVAVAVATAAAAEAAVAAAQAAAAAVMLLTAAEDNMSASPVEEAAAVRIQATFRGYLARKALCALRGLVKLQALIRGHLVRKQANATLRRMQALLMAQTRLRAQRMRMLEDDHAAERRSPQHPRRRRSYEMDRSGEEHVKIVEMDMGETPRRGRSSCSVAASEPRERRRAEYCGGQCSPAPSAAFTELMSPRAYSGHLEDITPFEPATARSSPYVYVPGSSAADGGEQASEFFPNYMANTQSSRAKARSQSAPRQRTDSPSPLERQPSRRRGGAAPVPRSVKMQRSSSHVGVPASAAAAYAQYQYQYQQYPWSVKLDRSSASLKDSECGSTSSVLTAATTVGYCRSLVGFEVHRSQY